MNDDIETWLNEALELMARNHDDWLPKIPEGNRPYFLALSRYVREADKIGDEYRIIVSKES